MPINPDAKAAARAQLDKPAVRFGDPRRFDNMRAYPFFYNFIAYPYQQSQINDATGVYEVSSANAEGPDGLTVGASGGVRDIPIIMDRDTNFHLLSIRYGAWNPVQEEPAGSRARLLNPQTSLLAGRSVFQAQMNQMDFYVNYLNVSVYMVSSGARDLYGGMQRDAVTVTREEIPIPVFALQGVQDGTGSVRTAFQLPKSATVRIRVVNTFPDALRVYGHLFGYKITL